MLYNVKEISEIVKYNPEVVRRKIFELKIDFKKVINKQYYYDSQDLELIKSNFKNRVINLSDYDSDKLYYPGEIKDILNLHIETVYTRINKLGIVGTKFKNRQELYYDIYQIELIIDNTKEPEFIILESKMNVL